MPQKKQTRTATSKEDMPIDPDDFSSLELKVTLKNVTTRANPKKGSIIRLVELIDRGMILDVPVKTGAVGHILALEITLVQSTDIKAQCQCTVRIDEVTNEDEGRDKIEASLAQVDEVAWAKIGKIFSKRQEDILTFFASAKGN